MLMQSSGSNAQLGEFDSKALLDSLEGRFYNEAAMKSMETQLLNIIVELKEKLAVEQPDKFDALDSKMSIIAHQMRNHRISARSDINCPVPLRSAAMKEMHRRKKALKTAEEH